MRNNSLFLFKNQTGGEYYQAGTTAAVSAFEQGGVNALLSFLASYQGGGSMPTSDPTAAFEQG